MLVYIDIFLFENFIINFFLLYVTMQTLNIKIKMLNIFLASILGSLYSGIAIYSKFKYLYNIPFKILIAMIMILISLINKKISINIKALVLFTLYSMILAGFCIFIEFNNNKLANVFIDKFSYKTLIFTSMLMYVAVSRITTFIRDRNEIKDLIYDIEIVTTNYTREVKAFFDTGNELREPATNLPVIIVERDIFKDYSDIDSYNMFLVPYKGVNGYLGKLKAFKPKYIKIHKSGVIEEKQAIIALCDDKLSSFSDYNALLSRGIL